MSAQQLSPFLSPGAVSKAESLAMLHLRRDHILPTKLTTYDRNNDGYEEGPVTNTRFGSFPHSTLIGIPWGSQIRASLVDTGSRGRRIGKTDDQNKKRKRGQEQPQDDISEENSDREIKATSKPPIAASTGFIHLLPPTVESWTASLPHRTQVVYTPDYSYILHRLRVRPGSVMIEAGAGSGSFSHAAARAVYNGSPVSSAEGTKNPRTPRRFGRVWSYDFHEQRVEKLKAEIEEHGLADILKVTHRDVYRDGFLQDLDSASEELLPQADAIFLDLPAPWLALRHLTRSPVLSKSLDTVISKNNPLKGDTESVSPNTAGSVPPLNHAGVLDTNKFRSPLRPDVTVHICTFSPCIEQVQRTISTLRELGWMDIEMVTLAHKRIEVRRERSGLQGESQRGFHASAANVEEAVGRLKEIEERAKSFQAQSLAVGGEEEADVDDSPVKADSSMRVNGSPGSVVTDRKLFKEGRLIHRAEPELKAHTSYLVFALLPRQWTAEDEERAKKAIKGGG